jgi:anti-sigma factor RsiW
MQHPDEGTIHAWLDGCVPDAEARAIEAHVAACGQCASAVAEARGLMAASSRILAARVVGPGGVVPTGEAASGTRAGAGVSVSAHERRRRLGVYARIAAALAFMTAGGLTLAHVGDLGLRPGDVRDAAPGVPLPAAAPPSTVATTVAARPAEPMRMEAAKPAPRAKAPVDQPNVAFEPAMKQSAKQAYDAAGESARIDSGRRFGAERFTSAAGVAASATAAPTAAPSAQRAAGMTEAELRPTALRDSADRAHGFQLVSGSVTTDAVRGVEHRTYESGPGVFVTLEITSVRGSALADSAYRVGNTSVLRWTEAGRQYVLRGPVTVAELRRMKESGAMR